MTALLSAFALLLVCMPVCFAESTEEIMIYHETFEEGKGNAVVSGGASLTQVTDKVFDGNDDGAALYVSNRLNDYDAADFNFSEVGMEEGKTYTIVVTGYVDAEEKVPEGANAQLQPVGDEFGWIDGKPMVAGESFILSGTYTVETALHNRLRAQSNGEGAGVPFYIGDILITGEPEEEIDVEVYHDTFESGIENAVVSGGASLTQVTDKVFDGNDDGAALYVSDRVNNWDAADFYFEDIGLENNETYKMTVVGYVDSDFVISTSEAAVSFQMVGDGDDAYGQMITESMTAGEAFTLSGEFTVDTSQYNRVRINSNDAGAGVPFYIGDILITRKGSSDEVEEPRPPAVEFTTVTFEDGTDQGFTGRAGTEILTVTDEANHTEDGSYALKVEGRSDTWHGPAIHVERNIDQGSEYKATAWVKLIEPASTMIQLSTQIGDGSGASYPNLDAKLVNADDGWVKFEGIYRYNNMRSDFATIYVECNNDETASFYIDDISFEPTGTGPVDIDRDLTPIKDAYEDYFLIGNAIAAEELEGVKLELLELHHNVATAGNAMKPGELQPNEGEFTFDAANAMVDKVLEEGLLMHGHVLVWHQQTGGWMNTEVDEEGNTVYLSREEALENMRTHIRTVMEEFEDRVISWDVVNEAMDDNLPTPEDWKASLRQSAWYHSIGDDFVEQAFLAAREVLDDHPEWDIKLYYNDYNLDNQNKALAVYNMVKELNDEYQETHPGKLLIDGVGMQGHYNISTNPTNVELSLERFTELGVEVSITELDITAGSNGELSDDLAIAQGYLYAQLFKIFKEHADNIPRVTFWGMDDGTSWRASQSPTLFDRDLQAKPAYYGVIDPDKFMEENEPEAKPDARNSSAIYGTPVIDGEIDSVWRNAPELKIDQYQMAWQGAAGTAKVLWDNENLYALIQVDDEQLDKENAEAYQQDSVEVFIDENNGKTSFYQDDDGQYRVNFENEASFNPASIEEGFESAVTTSAGADYVVEMKIPFKKTTPKENTKIGFDIQINDAKDGTRQSVAIWNDLTGVGYQDTSVYGVLTLKKKTSGGGSGGGSTGGGSAVPAPEKIEVVVNEQDEVCANIPVTGNADGDTVAVITDDHIDTMLESMKELSENEGQQVDTLKLVLDTTAEDVIAKLPGKALEKILESDPNASLAIAIDQCEIKFDSVAINAITNAGDGEVNISISKVAAADLSELSPENSEKIGDRPVYRFTVTSGGTEVTEFNGGALTLSMAYTPAEGEDPNAVLVYYIDSSNALIPLMSTYKDGTVRFTTPHLSKYAVGYNKVSFDGVEPTDYYYAPLTYFAARDIIVGSSFEAGTDVNRGAAIVLIMKAYGIEPLESWTDNFSDAEGPLAGYFAQAKAIGLSNGIGNNLVGAEQLLTREMLFTMIYNMQDVIGEFPAVEAVVNDPASFSDYDELSDWSLDAFSDLVEKGIIVGTGNNHLTPKSTANAGEIITVLYRLLSM